MNRGFTLIEVTIVVAIAGVLAAIAVPGYMWYIEKTREAVAVVHIHGISATLKAATVESMDILPDNTVAFASFCQLHDLSAKDPWGRPYEYLRIYGRPANENQARKDKNLHPINTYFDLYSRGADGKTAKPLTSGQSQDDIICANDGAYIGRASSFPGL